MCGGCLVLRDPVAALASGGKTRAVAHGPGSPGGPAKRFTDEVAVGDWVRHKRVLRKVAAVRPRLGACEVTLEFEPFGDRVASVLLVAFERIEVWRETVAFGDVADAALSNEGAGDPHERQHARPEQVRTLTVRIEAGDLVRFRGRLRRVLAVHVREHWPEVSLDFEPVQGAEDRAHLRTDAYVSLWRMGGGA